METWDPLTSGRLSLESDDENLDDVRQVGSFSVGGPPPTAKYCGITLPPKVVRPPAKAPINKSIGQKITSSTTVARVKKIKVPVAVFADYNSLSLNELKNELRKRNIHPTGNKETLIFKLLHDDKKCSNKKIQGKNTTAKTKNMSQSERTKKVKILENIEISSIQHEDLNEQQNEDNNDISNDVEMLDNTEHENDDSDEEEPNEELQEPRYLDITGESTVPILTEADLNHFAVLMEENDILEAAQMYRDSYLMTCRIASDSSGNSYVTGICSSEDKKLAYQVKIKLVDHVILETECECSDTAPFAQCKHVLIVMHGIIDFTKTNSINAKISFTKFNPVKAEDLVLRAKDANLKNIAKFDPRPVIESKKEYVSNFKNLIVNFCARNNCTMPILQIVKSTDVDVSKEMKLCEETGVLKF